ncbi:type IA DNA topoisomerase [Paenibacillus cymbidii]|uniref:type IA DNA topoisomerase n=1 Tax=Paenibacillus cymbidii TaxID=1639034 RepID=UPI00108065B4|nr:type IA DNA topoisomerase [Paenibacillus cymbidii]
MKTLVIAEKPDMGRNIAAAIDPKARNNRTHLEGERYIITWAIGHLIELAEPDKYDEKYKRWNFGDLPIIPDTFKLLPNPKTKDQLRVIADLAKRCDALVNACDAGREGQHIFSLIQRHLGLRQPVKRLWISDLTPETIRAGFAQLRDGAEYDNLTRAARSRSEADWLVGMNGTRAFTTKHNELLSVGRVQTPVLALIYDRQKEIEAFTSRKFYEVEAKFEQRRGVDADITAYAGKWQGGQLDDADKAAAIAAKVKDRPGRILSYEVKDTKEYPWRLYDLTLLQRDANGKYGFSAKKTLDLAQALYEKHKVISYPRTNSNYVGEQNIPEMHRSLDALRGTDYDALAQGANKSFVHKNNKAVCNPAKVEDHHAILPTNKKAGALSPDEKKLYDLIVRRFLSHFYPAAEYKMHTVLTEVQEELFKTTVKQLVSLGWKIIYEDARKGKKEAGAADDDDEGSVSAGGKRGAGKDKVKARDGGSGDEDEAVETDAPFALEAALPVLCVDAAAKEKETQPPKPFNEGTLLKAMESAGKQIEDEELRDAMKDAGLGTPATRAATIERLKQVGYIVMQGKRIVITAKGRAAVELIRGAGIELLTSPEMTGHWERRLSQIAKGQASDETFMDNVKRFTLQMIDKVRGQERMAKLAFGGDAPAAGSRGKAGARGGGASSGRGTRAGTAKSGTASTAEASRSVAVRDGADGGTTAITAASGGIAFVANCPRQGCGGRIFLGRKGYGCTHYRNGCTFVIWKESLGKSLTETMVRSLIEKGRTSKLKFKSKTGAPFEARIVLKDTAKGTLELERL